jgi:hypothetical protein
MAKNPIKTSEKRKTRATDATPKKETADTSWHSRFLELLGMTCNVTLAAKGSGVDRKTAYRHYESFPEFAAAWDNAKESAIEILEAEAWHRAMKQSDLLIIFLLKAHKPEKYRERTQLDVTSSGKPLLDPLAAALDKAYGNGKK